MYMEDLDFNFIYILMMYVYRMADKNFNQQIFRSIFLPKPELKKRSS